MAVSEKSGGPVATTLYATYLEHALYMLVTSRDAVIGQYCHLEISNSSGRKGSVACTSSGKFPTLGMPIAFRPGRCHKWPG